MIDDKIFKGVITTFLPDKAFGFIRPDGCGGADIFFHRDDVADDALRSRIEQGVRVQFDRMTNPKNGKLRAFEVRKLMA